MKRQFALVDQVGQWQDVTKHLQWSDALSPAARENVAKAVIPNNIYFP